MVASFGMSVSRLPLVGGHVALDLVNTVTPRVAVRDEEPHDHLVDPGALLRWAGRAGLVDGDESSVVAAAWRHDPDAGHATLDGVREIREALHEVLLAATRMVPPRPAVTAPALDRLHSRWLASAGRSALVLDPSREPAVRCTVGVAPALLVLDRAADQAVQLLRTGDLGRLRRCPLDAGGCGWLFLDRSRNGSRRWCRMADCGTEVKARRLTERRRAARTR